MESSSDKIVMPHVIDALAKSSGRRGTFSDIMRNVERSIQQEGAPVTDLRASVRRTLATAGDLGLVTKKNRIFRLTFNPYAQPRHSIKSQYDYLAPFDDEDLPDKDKVQPDENVKDDVSSSDDGKTGVVSDDDKDEKQNNESDNDMSGQESENEAEDGYSTYSEATSASSYASYRWR